MESLATRSTGAAGVASEERTAKRLGARQQVASGALEGAKGDMTLDDFLIEAKSTVKDSFSVKLEHLAKITQEATEIGKTPALTVTFTDAQGKPRRWGRWVLIPESEMPRRAE